MATWVNDTLETRKPIECGLISFGWSGAVMCGQPRFCKHKL